MNLIDYILILFGTIYGLLNIIAGSIQIKQKKINGWCSITMIIGGLFIVMSAFFSHLISYVFCLLLIGIILIHIAAINNGIKMYGKINLKHHLIRFIFSITLIVLFIIK